MSAYNKTFSKVSKPQSSVETRVSHSLITYYFFPCLVCESRVSLWIQVIFAISVSQTVPRPLSPICRRAPLLLLCISWPMGYPMHPPPSHLVLWVNYLVHMSIETYCIFGAVLTRMEDYVDLIFMNTFKSSTANSRLWMITKVQCWEADPAHLKESHCSAWSVEGHEHSRFFGLMQSKGSITRVDHGQNLL